LDWSSACAMLHERLADYLAEVESAVRALANVYVERYEEEILCMHQIHRQSAAAWACCNSAAVRAPSLPKTRSWAASPPPQPLPWKSLALVPC